MSGLVVEGLVKRYGGIEALRGVDLAVADGELLVVLGPSGSGKSTLLRVVAGLEEADGGVVRIGGDDVTRVQPGRRNVSMVFQSYALFPHMTVAENIGFGLVVRGMPRREAKERVAAAAGLAGCEPFLERRPGELSGGERQRVALARALVREPDLFLLDEPLSNLDAELRVRMRAELKALHRRVGATMLYVTHDQIEALMLGDRVAVLADGELQQLGTPDEIWAEPTNRFVARFVGFPAMNVVRPGGAIAPAGLPDRPVEVGVRAEHLRLGGEGAEAVVELVEPVGSEALVHVRAGDDELVARLPREARPQEGDRVRVSARREHLHVFDAETGERIPWT